MKGLEMKKQFLLSVAAAAACAAAAADLKIATVDMVDLVRLHPQHESNRTLVRSTDKDYKAKLERQQEEVKSLAAEGKKAQADLANPMLSQSAKEAAQKKIAELQQKVMSAQQELYAAAQHFQSELADLEGRLLKIETDDIRKKVAEYAVANGYDLILDIAATGYAAPGLEVTDEIMKSMGVDPAKRKETAKASGKGK